MTRRTWLGVAAILAVVAIGAALYLALLPLDSGDNFCGNAFVPRGRNNPFNGCAERLDQQRVAASVLATAAVFGAAVIWRRLRVR